MVPRPAALVAEHISQIQDAYIRERSTHRAVDAFPRALKDALDTEECDVVSAFIAGDLDEQYAEARPQEQTTSGRDLGTLLQEQLEGLYQDVLATQQHADRWRRLNTTGLALDFTQNPLLLGQFGRALQVDDAEAQRKVVSQAVDAIVEKALGEARTKKRRKVALQCAAGFFKAQVHEITRGEELGSAVARLQANEQYEDAVCMLWCQAVLIGLAQAIVKLGR